jgi:hypothetical protein
LVGQCASNKIYVSITIVSFASRDEMIIRDTIFVDNKAGILENAVYNAKYE